MIKQNTNITKQKPETKKHINDILEKYNLKVKKNTKINCKPNNFEIKPNISNSNVIHIGDTPYKTQSTTITSNNQQIPPITSNTTAKQISNNVIHTPPPITSNTTAKQISNNVASLLSNNINTEQIKPTQLNNQMSIKHLLELDKKKDANKKNEMPKSIISPKFNKSNINMYNFIPTVNTSNTQNNINNLQSKQILQPQQTQPLNTKTHNIIYNNNTKQITNSKNSIKQIQGSNYNTRNTQSNSDRVSSNNTQYSPSIKQVFISPNLSESDSQKYMGIDKCLNNTSPNKVSQQHNPMKSNIYKPQQPTNTIELINVNANDNNFNNNNNNNNNNTNNNNTNNNNNNNNNNTKNINIIKKINIDTPCEQNTQQKHNKLSLNNINKYKQQTANNIPNIQLNRTLENNNNILNNMCNNSKLNILELSTLEKQRTLLQQQQIIELEKYKKKKSIIIKLNNRKKEIELINSIENEKNK